MDIEVRRKENNRRIELRGLFECYILREGWGRFQIERGILENIRGRVLSFHIEKALLEIHVIHLSSF
jgi:hypothetical protein